MNTSALTPSVIFGQLFASSTVSEESYQIVLASISNCFCSSVRKIVIIYTMESLKAKPIQANVSTTKISKRHHFTAPPVMSLSHHLPLLTKRFCTSMPLPERIICVWKHDDDSFDVKETSPLSSYKSPHFESETRRLLNLYCTIVLPRNDNILSRITRFDYQIARLKIHVCS